MYNHSNLELPNKTNFIDSINVGSEVSVAAWIPTSPFYE